MSTHMSDATLLLDGTSHANGKDESLIILFHKGMANSRGEELRPGDLFGPNGFSRVTRALLLFPRPIASHPWVILRELRGPFCHWDKVKAYFIDLEPEVDEDEAAFQERSLKACLYCNGCVEYAELANISMPQHQRVQPTTFMRALDLDRSAPAADSALLVLSPEASIDLASSQGGHHIVDDEVIAPLLPSLHSDSPEAPRSVRDLRMIIPPPWWTPAAAVTILDVFLGGTGDGNLSSLTTSSIMDGHEAISLSLSWTDTQNILRARMNQGAAVCFGRKLHEFRGHIRPSQEILSDHSRAQAWTRLQAAPWWPDLCDITSDLWSTSSFVTALEGVVSAIFLSFRGCRALLVRLPCEMCVQ